MVDLLASKKALAKGISPDSIKAYLWYRDNYRARHQDLFDKIDLIQMEDSTPLDKVTLDV